MKKNTLLLVLGVLLSGAILIVSGCKDDDAETLGLIGTWKITDATFNPAFVDSNGNSITDAYSIFFSQPCQQDDLRIFEATNIYKEDEGVLKCDSTAEQTTTGSYIHSGNTITLINATNDTTVFNNATISNTTLTGTVAAFFGSGLVTVDFELTRQ